MNDDETGDWCPPNEAELKVLEARRERNNQISRLMANYMLKGYRMLDRICAECSTVLLQDQSGADYCVACKELHSETSKDDPAISAEAAAAAVMEQQQRILPVTPDEVAVLSVPEPSEKPPKSSISEGKSSDSESTSSLTSQTNVDLSRELAGLEGAVGGIQLIASYLRMKAKIDQLSKRLVESDEVDDAKNICTAIKACADTAASIKKLL